MIFFYYYLLKMHMSESILQSTIELINNNYCKFGAEETPLYFRKNSCP